MGDYASSSIEAVVDGASFLQLNNGFLSFNVSSLAIAVGTFLFIAFATKCYKTHQVRKALQNIHNKPHPVFGTMREVCKAATIRYSEGRLGRSGDTKLFFLRRSDAKIFFSHFL